MFAVREPAGSEGHQRGRRWIRTGLVFLAGFVLAVLPVAADVQWRSGARSEPSAMQRPELKQALVDLAARPEQRRVVIHFDGPLPTFRRNALESNGIRLLSYLGGNAYFATLTPDLDPTRAAALPGTLAVEAIDPANKLHPDLARGIEHPWAVVSRSEGPSTSPTVAVYVLFHRDFDAADRAASLIERYDGTVRSRMEAINGVVAHLPSARVADLAADDDVMYVEPPLPALEALNDDVRARTGADIVNVAPYRLDGSGVTVLVYDGGQVYAHADLAGRLTIGQSDTGSVASHPTHVACTIAGDGGQYSGMAPAAHIVSYEFETEGGLQQGFLYTDPGDIEDDYSEAFALYGVDLSNNSIGSNTAPNGFPCDWEGNYGATGAMIDELVRGALGEPFRVVWANGNERSSGRCGTDYLTTAPPSCAKNSLTVGAVNSNDDSITYFTSWGPCDDGRLKPDVSAPGCQSGGDNTVTSCDSGGGYTGKCGTSMASPAAAGVAALLLQQYREAYPNRPDFRNSLLRAMLAQTAADLDNPGPDYKSGYGSIRAQPAADLIIEERFVEDEVTQAEVYTFTMNVPSNGEVKVTLAWDDPAGTPGVNPVLVNDLDLRIVGPDDTVYYPWTLNPSNPGAPAIQTVRDSVNNIEQVRIANASPGTYLVEVEGANIAEGPAQPFGVATSHAPIFCTARPTFGGIDSIAPGSSCGEIELAWSEGQSNCSPAGQITYNVYTVDGVISFPPSLELVEGGLTTMSYTAVGLEPGKRYDFIVRAEDSKSGEDLNADIHGATTPTEPDIQPPIFDGAQSVTAGEGCGEVVLEWQPAIESCSGPTTYEVHRSIHPSFVPGPDTRVATTLGLGFFDTSVPPGTTQTYLVRAIDTLGNADANDVRMSVTPTNFDLELFYTAFEPDDAGWSVVDPNDAATGNWEHGDPVETSYQPGDDATPDGVNCWITGLGAGSSNGDVDDGTTTLLSAAYDLSGAVDPTVTYARWFTNDRGGSPGDATDRFRVDVSNDDGQNWTSLEEVGAGTPLAWVPVSHALPVTPSSQVRFRFTAADLGAGSLVEAGIDEFALIGPGQACLQCTDPLPPTLCEISVRRASDDIRIVWTGQPAGTRAVVYHVTGCDPSERVKLGSSDGSFFVHEDAMLSPESFNYRVTVVDECGNEQLFCGTTDCP